MSDSNTNDDTIFGTAGAAEWADVSEDTIRAGIGSQRLRASRPGGGTRGPGRTPSWAGILVPLR